MFNNPLKLIGKSNVLKFSFNELDIGEVNTNYVANKTVSYTHLTLPTNREV